MCSRLRSFFSATMLNIPILMTVALTPKDITTSVPRPTSKALNAMATSTVLNFATANISQTTLISNTTTPTYEICRKHENAGGNTCDDLLIPTISDCVSLTAQGFDCRGCKCGLTTSTIPPPVTNATTTTILINITAPKPPIEKDCSFPLDRMSPSKVFSLFVLPVLWVVLIFLAIFGDMILISCVEKNKKKPDRDKDDEDKEEDLHERVGRIMFEHSNMGKMQFFSNKRSWQKFNKRNRPPPKPEDSVRFSYGLNRQVYRVLRGSATLHSWRAAVMTACLAGICMWALMLMREMQKRNCFIEPKGARYSTFEVFVKHIKALSQLTKAIKSYVVFMLIFYVKISVGNWEKAFSATRALRDELTSFALGIATVRPSFHPYKRQKYNIYRYINIVHFYCYANNLPEFHKEKRVHTMLLQSAGLITPEEKRRLDNSEDPADMTHRWLIRSLGTMHLHFREKNFLMLQFNKVINELQSVRGAVNAYPPLSFVQIMKLLVDLYLFCLPIVFVSEMYIHEDDSYYYIQLMPCLACLLVSFAYQGLMAMVDILKNPFGPSPDQFNINSILLELDRQLYDILVHDTGRHFYGKELARVKRRYDRTGLSDPETLNLKFLVEDIPLWEEMFDDHHNQYFYYNNKTQESSWNCPFNFGDTFQKKIPANKKTATFMTRYDAVVRLQSNFRRALTKNQLRRLRPEEAQDDDGD